VPTVIEVEGAGLRETSYIPADRIRTVSQRRLTRRIGACDETTLVRVERALSRLPGLRPTTT
jgi:mRNA-degrading endonuclease toxin of MazEF toxin-antitoxin module